MFGNDVTLSYVLVLGAAAISMHKLVTADRITQAVRYWVIRRLDKAGGFLPYHIQYLIGCSLCSPMWYSAALYFTRQYKVSQWITVLLAARLVAYATNRWLNETAIRDWPNRADDSAIEWPPTK